MDPRERIRQFLEQRRELGETEFVLDTMGVDEALRVLGLGAGAPRRDPGGRGARGAGASPPPAANWREALGGPPTPAIPTPRETPVEDGARRGTADDAPSPGPPPRRQFAAPPPDLRNQPVPARTDSPPPEPRRPVTEPHAADRIVPLEEIPTGVVIGTPSHDLFKGESASPYASLDDIARAVAACRLCSLYQTAKNPVPGVGNPNADFVCVGEAPGANEDEQGVPFVGQAGQLLTKILAAINLSRDDVFICNVLKHRPPGNRNPMPDEVQACSPYLVRQIELLRPKVLLALGTFAAQTLLQTREPIGKLRGKIHRYYGVPLVVTYHPAALLRNPSWKRPTWEDVQLARRLLDRAAPGA